MNTYQTVIPGLFGPGSDVPPAQALQFAKRAQKYQAVLEADYHGYPGSFYLYHAESIAWQNTFDQDFPFPRPPGIPPIYIENSSQAAQYSAPRQPQAMPTVNPFAQRVVVPAIPRFQPGTNSSFGMPSGQQLSRTQNPHERNLNTFVPSFQPSNLSDRLGGMYHHPYNEGGFEQYSGYGLDFPSMYPRQDVSGGILRSYEQESRPGPVTSRSVTLSPEHVGPRQMDSTSGMLTDILAQAGSIQDSAWNPNNSHKRATMLARAQDPNAHKPQRQQPQEQPQRPQKAPSQQPQQRQPPPQREPETRQGQHQQPPSYGTVAAAAAGRQWGDKAIRAATGMDPPAQRQSRDVNKGGNSKGGNNKGQNKGNEKKSYITPLIGQPDLGSRKPPMFDANGERRFSARMPIEYAAPGPIFALGQLKDMLRHIQDVEKKLGVAIGYYLWEVDGERDFILYAEPIGVDRWAMPNTIRKLEVAHDFLIWLSNELDRYSRRRIPAQDMSDFSIHFKDYQDSVIVQKKVEKDLLAQQAIAAQNAEKAKAIQELKADPAKQANMGLEKGKGKEPSEPAPKPIGTVATPVEPPKDETAPTLAGPEIPGPNTSTPWADDSDEEAAAAAQNVTIIRGKKSSIEEQMGALTVSSKKNKNSQKFLDSLKEGGKSTETTGKRRGSQ